MLFTVGHSNRTFDELMCIIKAHSIDVLVDVRGGSAGSRTFPHFNKMNFEIEIPKYGIEYVHIPELGGRRGKTPNADPLLNGEWRLDAFRYYADYAYYSESFQKGINTLLTIGNEVNAAFMCSEAVPWRCHRSIVADYLIKIHNKPITHLLSVKQTLVGVPHSHSCVYNGRVIYPKLRSYQGELFVPN